MVIRPVWEVHEDAAGFHRYTDAGDLLIREIGDFLQLRGGCERCHEKKNETRSDEAIVHTTDSRRSRRTDWMKHLGPARNFPTRRRVGTRILFVWLKQITKGMGPTTHGWKEKWRLLLAQGRESAKRSRTSSQRRAHAWSSVGYRMIRSRTWRNRSATKAGRRSRSAAIFRRRAWRRSVSILPSTNSSASMC